MRGRVGRRAAAFSVMVSVGALVSPAMPTGAAPSGAHVLLVGNYRGVAGKYTSIQAAVDAARPGDWVLVAPGDYHETSDVLGVTAAAASDGDHGGVVIKTPGIHLRGMNRNTVIVDGTAAGASTPCSAAQQFQNLGPVIGGKAIGRNGIVVWKANGVSIENLTACNFLGGSGASGNEIWWNGDDGTGKIGLTGYAGSYLTATTSYYANEATGAQYGIFSSAAAGPANWDQLYASNMNDSGMYVGACQQLCDVTIDHAWMESNALGYSGTNSGGAVVIENSQFDNNQDGLDTNTQLAGDPPAPQNGDCPGGAISPITHTRSCWVFWHNNVHDNNNANAPASGSAAAGPAGTGMTVSGARNVTVEDNTFSNNGAWGVLFVPYPDSGTSSIGQTCHGTGGFELSGFGCVYNPEGDALVHNTFTHDGFFANPTNADFGQIVLNAGIPSNCFGHNVAPEGSQPTTLESQYAVCGKTLKAANTGGALLGQVLCDTRLAACPAGSHYPVATQVQLERFPEGLPTMPNPCRGVPANPWCSPAKR